MAISSYNTILKWGESADAVSKVVDIKDFGDLGGEAEEIETTTLSDKAKTSIAGIQDQSGIPFTCNYDKETYATVKATENKDLFFALELQDGSSFKWQGQYTTMLSGKGVNEAMEFTINVLPSTEIVFDAGTSAGA